MKQENIFSTLDKIRKTHVVLNDLELDSEYLQKSDRMLSWNHYAIITFIASLSITSTVLFSQKIWYLTNNIDFINVLTVFTKTQLFKNEMLIYTIGIGVLTVFIYLILMPICSLTNNKKMRNIFAKNSLPFNYIGPKLGFNIYRFISIYICLFLILLYIVLHKGYFIDHASTIISIFLIPIFILITFISTATILIVLFYKFMNKENVVQIEVKVLKSLIRSIYLCDELHTEKLYSIKKKVEILKSLRKTNIYLRDLDNEILKSYDSRDKEWKIRSLDKFIKWTRLPQENTFENISKELINYLIPLSTGMYHHLPKDKYIHSNVQNKYKKNHPIFFGIAISFPLIVAFILITQLNYSFDNISLKLLLGLYVIWIYISICLFIHKINDSAIIHIKDLIRLFIK